MNQMKQLTRTNFIQEVFMIKVYSKHNCMQCEMTKEFLKQHNVEFEEINIEENEEALE